MIRVSFDKVSGKFEVYVVGADYVTLTSNSKRSDKKACAFIQGFIMDGLDALPLETAVKKCI